MKRKIFSRGPVFYLVLFFSWLILGQSVLACDEPRDECSVQLDIKWVDLDYEKRLIYVWGENFDNGKFPVVTLGGIPLHVNYYDREWVVATLPSVPKEIPYGQYKLRVKTGEGQRCKDRHSVKLHPTPPEKPSCAPCPPCPEQCVCPPGEQGPQGPPGVSGYERILTRASYTLGRTEAPISESQTAACSPGKKLLGGGGGITDITPDPQSSFVVPQIIYSGPDPNGGEAWVLRWGYLYLPAQTTIDVLVYAICANVEP